MKKLSAIIILLIFSSTNAVKATKFVIEETMHASKRLLPSIPKMPYHSLMTTQAHKPQNNINHFLDELSETYLTFPDRLESVDDRGELYRTPTSQKQSASLSPKKIQEVNEHTLFVDLEKKKK